MVNESSGLGSAFTGRAKRGGKYVNQSRGHPRETKVRPAGGYPEAQNEVLSRVLSEGAPPGSLNGEWGFLHPAAPNALAVREGSGAGTGGAGVPFNTWPPELTQP